MSVVEPVFAVKALNHKFMANFFGLRLFAVAIDIKKVIVVNILFVLKILVETRSEGYLTT